MVRLAMTGSVVIRARVDQQLKTKVEKVLAASGVTVSDAIRLLIMHVAREGVLPFEPILPGLRAGRERKREMHNTIAPEMRQHAIRVCHVVGFGQSGLQMNSASGSDAHGAAPCLEGFGAK